MGFGFARSSSDISAVCAYSVSAMGELFNEGKFKTPVTVETSHVKWVMYSGELPVPRPGAVSQDPFVGCIINIFAAIFGRGNLCMSKTVTGNAKNNLCSSGFNVVIILVASFC